jgi:hypothetical protein
VKEEDRMSGEQTVTVDSLDASLDDLLKAADASDVKDKLEKAVRGEHPGASSVNYETSGHYDEGGQAGGGVAGMDEAGSIDDLMIGKMIDAGVAAETVADFVAFMRGAQEDDEDDDDYDEDDEDMYEKGGYDQHGERLQKSYPDEFAADPDIAEAIDASPFMEALTAKTVQAIDELQKSQLRERHGQKKYNSSMAGAVYQVGTLLKSQSAVIAELSKRLGIVETTPMPQKGATGSAVALHKALPGETTTDPNTALSRREVTSTLTYMNLVKGMKTVCGQKTGELAVMAEAGGSIDRDTLDEVQRFLATHPNEGKLAKSYQ